MEYYTIEELSQIVENSAKVLDVEIDEESKTEIAKRSRGTPRLANRILKHVRNFAQVKYNNEITKEVVKDVLNFVGIDKHGLDENDIKYLTAIQKIGDGKAVGLTTLAASIGEDIGTIEDVYEPYLLSMGFINKTPRGRTLTEKAIEHIK
jgi:Holliday junction DNA helicase RuvB